MRGSWRRTGKNAELEKELVDIRKAKKKDDERIVELEKLVLAKDEVVLAKDKEVRIANQLRNEAQAEFERFQGEKAGTVKAFGELVRSLERDLQDMRAEVFWDAIRGPTFKSHVGMASGSKLNEGFTLAIAQAQHLAAFRTGFNPLAKLKVDKMATLEDLPESEEDEGEEDEDARLKKDELCEIFK